MFPKLLMLLASFLVASCATTTGTCPAPQDVPKYPAPAPTTTYQPDWHYLESTPSSATITGSAKSSLPSAPPSTGSDTKAASPGTSGSGPSADVLSEARAKLEATLNARKKAGPK